MLCGASSTQFASHIAMGRYQPEHARALRAIRYFITYDTYDEIRASLTSRTEQDLFAGLVHSRVIEPISDACILAQPIGTCSSIPSKVLKLAICSNHTLFSKELLDEDDKTILSRNGVLALQDDEQIVSWIYSKINKHRILSTWTLTDGGAIFPRDIFSPQFLTASSIRIYDRYFNKSSGEALKDVLEHCANTRGNKVDISLSIYSESGTSKLLGELVPVVAPYISDTNKISAFRITKPGEKNIFTTGLCK